MGADYLKLKPFIVQAEGGDTAHSNDPLDKGGDTRVGVTFEAFKEVIGDDHDRFLQMYGHSDDWNTVFKHYWDLACADQIDSQRIANQIVDFIWGSGRHSPSLTIEHLLNMFFGDHLAEDGQIGPATIADINSADEPSLYNDIINAHSDYYDAIVARDPTQEKWINGWHNRLHALDKFCNDPINQ